MEQKDLLKSINNRFKYFFSSFYQLDRYKLIIFLSFCMWKFTTYCCLLLWFFFSPTGFSFLYLLFYDLLFHSFFHSVTFWKVFIFIFYFHLPYDLIHCLIFTSIFIFLRVFPLFLPSFFPCPSNQLEKIMEFHKTTVYTKKMAR